MSGVEPKLREPKSLVLPLHHMEIFTIFGMDFLLGQQKAFTKPPCLHLTGGFFARMERFELPTTVLETVMIPFHHTRMLVVQTGIEPVSQDFQSHA